MNKKIGELATEAAAPELVGKKIPDQTFVALIALQIDCMKKNAPRSGEWHKLFDGAVTKGRRFEDIAGLKRLIGLRSDGEVTEDMLTTKEPLGLAPTGAFVHAVARAICELESRQKNRNRRNDDRRQLTESTSFKSLRSFAPAPGIQRPTVHLPVPIAADHLT